MTSPDFTVVVPVYNAAQYVERCVRALLSQTYPADRYEILLVDNNSTDRSAAIARKFERVKLLYERQQGSYAARNRGVLEARGEIVVFTDPDCEPQCDWLEQIGLAMAEPQTGVVLGDRRFAGDLGILGMLAAYESALAAHIFAAQRVECYYAYTNNMAVRMEILKALNGFQPIQRGADSLFLRMAIERYGQSIVRYAPRVLVRHLEIANICDYLEKKSIYGEVNRNRSLATPSCLPLAQRLELALRVQREYGCSLAINFAFLAALAAGASRFEWGRWRVR